jgi:hypothetical protein
MFTQNRPTAFSNMNKPKYVAPDMSGGYKSWKKQDVKEVKKEVNISSFSDFPDLVKEAPKKTVFEGNSLANKLKEVIAAEEEAAIQKRLKKGDTPEMILRESCTILPLKTKTKTKTLATDPMEVPWWVTDSTQPILFPAFRPKSLAQLAEERKWRRLGIRPSDVMLHDEPDDEEYIPDTLSIPSSDISMEEMKELDDTEMS